MESRNLRDAIAAAEEANPNAGAGGSDAWETDNYPVKVVVANYNETYHQIGMQIERKDNGRKKWFNLKFDEANSAAVVIAGRYLKWLGVTDEFLDQLAVQFPDDTDAQLAAAAPFLIGVEFTVEAKKVPAKSDPKKFINYFDVAKDSVTVAAEVPGSAAPGAELGGLSGLMGG